MRVLHLTRDFPPLANGGISRAVENLVRELQVQNIMSIVVSFDAWKPHSNSTRPQSAMTKDQTSHVHGLFRVNRQSQLQQMREFAENSGAQLVHVHDAMLWKEAKTLSAKLAIETVYTVHVYHKAMNTIRALETTAGAKAENQALAQASLISTPSESMKELLIKDFPESAKRLRVASWGVKRTWRGEKNRVKEAIYAGRFSDIKGNEDLRRIIPGVLERVPEARFLLAGGVPFNPRAEKKWIASIRECLDEPCRSRLQAPGWLADQVLAQRLNSTWVMISPSKFETFGLSVIEAMSHSVPVISTNCLGFDTIFSHGQGGYFVDAGDTDAMIEHLVKILLSEKLRNKLGNMASAQIRKKCLWKYRIHDWLRIYRELL